jgi:pimeloyl-ACP methyl ester carboxylesterase
LGYPERRVYRFSYAGIDGPRLHRPFSRADSYGDLDRAARRMRALLEAIASKHPGRDVDLIAHSQGGVVARAYLTKTADVSDRSLPRVEHLVTFASPLTGAPRGSG